MTDSAPHSHATDTFLPERTGWVARQLARIDETGDTASVAVQGREVVVVTMRGARSGQLRRVPVMRVEHDGTYAAVASKGGAERDPVWVHNLRADGEVLVQDGTDQVVRRARLLPDGPERDAWWRRAVDAFPPYADYQERCERLIPVFLLEPTD